MVGQGAAQEAEEPQSLETWNVFPETIVVQQIILMLLAHLNMNQRKAIQNTESQYVQYGIRCLPFSVLCSSRSVINVSVEYV